MQIPVQPELVKEETAVLAPSLRRLLLHVLIRAVTLEQMRNGELARRSRQQPEADERRLEREIKAACCLMHTI